MAKPKVSEELKRKPCYGKVSPETRVYLDGMAETNDGRRVDRLVELAGALRESLKKTPKK